MPKMKVQIPSEIFTTHFMGCDIRHLYMSQLTEPFTRWDFNQKWPWAWDVTGGRVFPDI